MVRGFLEHSGRRICSLCLSALLCPGLAAFAQQPPSPVREITPLRGDLYRATENGRATIFLVTSEGIVLADPLNSAFAVWLKNELAVRFPGRPVRYVLHTSHSHDRAAGASVFDKTAETIAHEAFSSERDKAAHSLPAPWAAFDRNHDSVLERSEALAAGPDALMKDWNRDGEVTAAEAWSDVAIPKRSFATQRAVDLGGQHVEVIHPGEGLGRDAAVILFRAERVLFAPVIPLGEAPQSFAAASPSAFAASLREVERLPFDVVVSDTGDTGSPGDLALVREYAEALNDGVKKGFRRGSSVEQLQASLDLHRFSSLRFVDSRRGRNIAEAYRGLHEVRIVALGAAQLVMQPRMTPVCAQSAIPTIIVSCKGLGGTTAGSIGGGAVMFGRVGGGIEISRGGEMTASDQTFGSRVSTFAHRETLTAFLFRYEPTTSRRWHVVGTAGFARITATQRVDSSYLGHYTLPSTATASVVGGDIGITAGPVQLVAPVRFTHEPAELFQYLGQDVSHGTGWNYRVGLGVMVPIARLVK